MSHLLDGRSARSLTVALLAVALAIGHPAVGREPLARPRASATLFPPVPAAPTYSAKRVVLLMGSRFDFGAYAKTQQLADSAVDAGIAEVTRIENVISAWQPHTETSTVNAAAGLHPVRVSPELLGLIRRSLRVSELTAGAFDITAGGLRGLYRSGRQDTVLPSVERLAAARALVDYRAVEIDERASTVFVSRANMRIGFGAIGKGYAANRALAVMRSIDGVVGAVANASGDMATWGSDGSGRPWTIAIADPRRPGSVVGEIALNDVAVVTSGDYERFFTVGQTRYSHILDPRTALPTTGVRSVTVVCPDAELADALATAMFVLGPVEAIALADRLRDVEALVIDAGGEVTVSANLRLGSAPPPASDLPAATLPAATLPISRPLAHAVLDSASAKTAHDAAPHPPYR